MSTVAWAQEALEIFTLRHRTADQILPLLRPLLEPGATLTGQGNQLIVRTSARNLADLRTALAATDRPLRRFVISVRFGDAREFEGQGIDARISPNGVGVATTGVRSTSDERVDQRLQVLEGGRAYISAGVSRPLRERTIRHTPNGRIVTETTVIQDAMTGFEVVPRLAGDSVVLDVSPQRVQAGSSPERLDVQHTATQVRAPVGEWVEISGSRVERGGRTQGLVGERSARGVAVHSVWVKVEELSP